MELLLKELPPSLQHHTGGPVPKWMRVLRPDTADSLMALETESGGLVYNDIWRSAEISLWAMQQKAGVQAPGYSAHGFGLAVDFAVDATLARRGWSYAQFLAFMEAHRWFCHRRDGKRGSEDWHFHFLPKGPIDFIKLADPKKPGTWALPVETRMLELYGNDFLLDTIAEQKALRTLKLYTGDVDGIVGPATKKAAEAFRRKWCLALTDPMARYLRTLAFVTATKKTVPLPVG